jgi:hypothetical protein
MFGRCKGTYHEKRPSLAEICHRCLCRTAARLAVAAPVPQPPRGHETPGDTAKTGIDRGTLIPASDLWADRNKGWPMASPFQFGPVIRHRVMASVQVWMTMRPTGRSCFLIGP